MKHFDQFNGAFTPSIYHDLCSVTPFTPKLTTTDPTPLVPVGLNGVECTDNVDARLRFLAPINEIAGR